MYKMNLDPAFLITIFLYVVLIGFALFALYYEIKDISTKKHLEGTDYEKGDSTKEIKDKILQASKYETNTISWRKSYIIAAITSIIIIILLKNTFPTGIELASTFLVLYIIIYMAATIYKKWVASVSIEKIEALLKKI